MEDDELYFALAAVLIIKKKKLMKNNRKWSRQLFLKRNYFSHANLISELRSEPDEFRNYLRMDESTYKYLLNLVTPKISKADSVMRQAISPHDRLSATLRFLATGRSYGDLKFSTCISKPALSAIIPETCDAIYSALKSTFLKVSFLKLLIKPRVKKVIKIIIAYNY